MTPPLPARGAKGDGEVKDAKQLKLKAKPGMTSVAKEPALILVEGGRRAYLWIGNDAEGNEFCFATVSGAAKLRKLAKAILAEVGK